MNYLYAYVFGFELQLYSSKLMIDVLTSKVITAHGYNNYLDDNVKHHPTQQKGGSYVKVT